MKYIFRSLLLAGLCSFFLISGAVAQSTLLIPDRVFDGENVHKGWTVLVTGDRIRKIGKESTIKMPAGTQMIRLKGMTLSPGLIEGHSHFLLHPYDEASWNDQVLRESRTLRVARATVHARNTLLAGFTTVRDLGTEGAGYADVGLRRAIRLGIIPGPRMIVAGPAIVATGSYGPKGFHPDFNVPLGAEEADGWDGITRVTRDQIGHGVDVIKIYADYRWGPHGEAMPTFTVEEIKHIVEVAGLSGRSVVAHAGTAHGMMNAILGGVSTIEHGDGATREVFQAMIDRDIVWIPTLAAGEAISSYSGWKKGIDAEPQRITEKKRVFREALDMGVTIGMGGDVGVFTHGKNAWEIVLLVEYGMTPLQAMRATTSVNARAFGIDDEVGYVREGLTADLVALQGNPIEDINATRDVRFVMQSGRVVLQPDEAKSP